jgi:hypothetical protein
LEWIRDVTDVVRTDQAAAAMETAVACAWSAGIATVASEPLDQVPADGVLAVSGAQMRQVR